MCPTPNLASVSVPPIKPRGEEKLDGSGSGPCGDLELFADVDSSVLDELLQTFKKCYLGISHQSWMSHLHRRYYTQA
ncbi:hypothetical protein NC653_020287 [Populus alba x Populus x berolinensis]|uniref:Uncharacterized protein n=1 Tax=Populus alba x Populus x berolinensis TaxID=444605 RepID=A0AAD6MMH5_9ROSI|nr:hypothetical protein NC653_020287 [Populus alba x Populus x berolinensis]